MARILVIDDEEVLREVFQSVLEHLGHEVFTEASGRRVLERCRELGLDLVITDLVMPDVEGLETIMSLRQSFPELRIIAMSGGSRGGVGDALDTAIRLGAALSLQKPFSLEELQAAVDQVLGGSTTPAASSDAGTPGNPDGPRPS